MVYVAPAPGTPSFSGPSPAATVPIPAAWKGFAVPRAQALYMDAAPGGGPMPGPLARLRSRFQNARSAMRSMRPGQAVMHMAGPPYVIDNPMHYLAYPPSGSVPISGIPSTNRASAQSLYQ